MNKNDDIERLLENLPYFVQRILNNHSNKENLLEIVLDLGRRPEARFIKGSEYLSRKIMSSQDLDFILKRTSQFDSENRAGIEQTLHRICCIRNRQSLVNGLTCRIGRAVFGTICIIRDLLECNQSILILGKPGSGKTTIIREISRILSNEMNKRVIIIDTSHEIAGDSDIPHSGIGKSRRFQVSTTELQYQIMVEAVENHMPEVIIIDEIGTEQEALAARTLAEKGVQLVGTAHGNNLKNLIKNPMLTDLVGGIQYVILSDEEARKRKTQKSILERKASPAFQVAIEINQQYWIIHQHIEKSVDLILRKDYFFSQTRELKSNKDIYINYTQFELGQLTINPDSNLNWFLLDNTWKTVNCYNKSHSRLFDSKKFRIYNLSFSKNLMCEAFYNMENKFIFTNSVKKADIIIALKKHLKKNLKLKKLSKQHYIKIYILNHKSLYQIVKLISNT
uniref:AAA+ ATPase domain-containing protein n=1 Tax=Proboscia sp. TaxID=1923967 RepID=A0A2U9NM68_9STRA|nr:hypothetical protein ycf45 [Proboscia sp.]AWT38213.1 hypothetical protein ycf45 [Proboscia sp.]